jgi:UDP-N-acetylmuramate dehydrogenase
MDWSKVFETLKTQLPNIEIKQNEPLAPYTTLHIGGPADIFIHTKTSEEFKSVLSKIGEDNVFFDAESSEQSEGASTAKKSLSSQNFTILGNGSNVLISDTGIRGIVIKNESQEIELLKDNQVKISSGTQLSYAINFCADHNLSGFEEFAYIPSTIGGAIYGNIHGDLKHNFSEFIESVEFFDSSNPTSIILSATFKLNPGDPQTIKDTAQKIIERKSTNQLMNSAGCTFKNPEKSISFPIWNEAKSTGWIIDHELNLKGKSIGGAQISPLHANFIINTGKATAKDYLDLVELIQSQVKAKFNFEFELEIKLLGEF